MRPHQQSIEKLDIDIRNGKFSRIAPNIKPEETKEIFDAKNLLGFPGVVDSHMHVGIYQPLSQDAVSESKAFAG
ncbi:hypothetical protein [Plectonema radiosum]|uniref:hypothetical protein n=1 Tax=Plectonema radiosum TaxID=945768 RepID=UPI001D13A072|nr:hypothetical protein [Plectonema radiosum]